MIPVLTRWLKPIAGATGTQELGTLVDPDWYRNEYPDIIAAGLDPVQHFLSFGHAERRLPNQFFKPDWYLLTYKDVAERGEDPIIHYVREGWLDGRNPGPDFDSQQYLAANPEVAASGWNPLAHYLKKGRRQGLQTFPVLHSSRERPADIDDWGIRLASGKLVTFNRGDFANIMRIVYRTFLDRAISRSELDQYVSAYQNGKDFIDMVAGIASSDEAQAVCQKRDFAAGLSETTISLRDAEVTNIIAHLFEAHLGRSPALNELHSYSVRVTNGEALSAILHEIASIPEGQALRQRRDSAVNLIETSIILGDKEVTDIIVQGYEGYLGRSPAFDEVSGYLIRVKNGDTVSAVLHEIASSAEGQARRQRRDTALNLIETSIILGDDEVTDIIAQGYEGHLGRSPAFNEVSSYFTRVKNGDTVSAVLHEIASSAEGQALRQRRDTALSLIETSIMLGDNEVIGIIAQAYEDHLGRPPAFNEAYTYLTRVKNGEALPAILHDIASSHQARRAANTIKQPRDVFSQAIRLVYQNFLNRTISETEIEMYFQGHLRGDDFIQVLISVYDSVEAEEVRRRLDVSGWPAGRFIQLLFEIFLKRGASPREISYHRKVLEAGNREQLLRQFFLEATRELEAERMRRAVSDATVVALFGQKTLLTADRWRARAHELASEPKANARYLNTSRFSRFPFASTAAPLVSVITSLYKGGEYIKHFLDNITSQSIFREYCELLIIDADSPENEFQTIQKYCKRFPNINYKRFDYRLGIYDAWNVGIQNARGQYCTNANLDDCRRDDSLELQASTLDALPFVDVVYQDVFYSFDKNSGFEEIAKFGFSTKLPIVSRYNLMEFNCPHNAPMWRRSLHDEIGMFDTNYKSAGDYDLWIRALGAGKTFFKLNDPHVAYFVNPNGLSTRSDTLSRSESRDVLRRHFGKMVSPNMIIERSLFEDKLRSFIRSDREGASRYELAQAALRGLSSKSRNVGN